MYTLDQACMSVHVCLCVRRSVLERGVMFMLLIFVLHLALRWHNFIKESDVCVCAVMH